MIIFKDYNLTLMNKDPSEEFEALYLKLYVTSEQLLDVLSSINQ